MKFLNLELSILLIIPAIVAIVDFLKSHQKKNSILKFASKDRIAALTSNFSNKKYIVKKILLYSSLILFTLTLMEPTFGKQRTVTVKKNTDIIFLVDVSLSMLSEDVGTSRLQRAKIEAQKIISSLNGERVSLIAFAQTAAIILPLTTDYSAFVRMLNTLTPNSLSRQGTNMLGALQVANTFFESGRKNNNKIILVLSDGENHSSSVSRVAQILKKQNTTVYSVGIGSYEGSVIPITNPFTKTKQNLQVAGEEVISKLNDKSLKQVANLTGGNYFQISEDPYYIEILTNTIASTGSISENQEEITINATRYKVPLAIVLLFLVLERSFSNKKSKLSFFKNKNMLLILMLSLPVYLNTLQANTGLPNPFDSSAEKAYELYAQKEYAKAEELYTSIITQEGESIELLNNLALTKAQSSNKEKMQEAVEHFNSGIDQLKKINNKHPGLEDFYYNKGNTYMKLENFSAASLAYINSLRINPENEAARFNLELALKKSDTNSSSSQQKEKEEEKDSQKAQSPESQDSKQSDSKNSETKEDYANKDDKQNKNNAQKGDTQQKETPGKTEKIDRKRAEEIIKKIEENLAQQRKIGEHREFLYDEKPSNPW